MLKKLENLLLGRDFPLPILGLEAVDKWFVGLGKSKTILKYILSNIAPGQFGIIRIEGVEYVGRLTPEDWDGDLFEAKRLLASGSGLGWTEDHCRSVVSGLLKESVREFRPLLWHHASKLCHFIDEDGTKILASVGRGVEQVVEAVLFESDHPLHYSKIAEKAAKRIGKPVDVRRAHHAASAVGILLGRGTYGLEKHIKLSEHESEVIREIAEEAICGGTDGRQWHTSEIVAVITESELINTDALDKYVVDHILKQSDLVHSLGRMTWSRAQSEVQGTSNRIDLRQAVISVVQEAGGPLTTAEIRQRLVAIRGVNEYFQISAAEPLIRIGTGLWGLIDRDLPIGPDERIVLVEHFISALHNKGMGIHVSEAADLIAASTKRELSTTMAFSIAALDPRLGVNPSQYLFLREWGSARRETISGAVRAVLEHALDPLSLDDIVEGVQRQVGRAFEKQRISACLQAIEATVDPATDRWSYTPHEEAQDEEPSEIYTA